MSDENTRLLHELIGRFNEFSENTKRQLDDIRDRLDKGNHAFDRLHQTCAVRGETLQNYGRRLEALEEKDTLGGTTKTEKFAIWGQALAWIAKIIANLFGINI